MNLTAIYERYVFPRLETLVTGRLKSERERIMASAQGVLLEIGAGAGQNFDYLPERVSCCIALEPAEGFIRKSSRKISRGGGFEKIRIIQGKAENLPLASESVDTALSFLVLCTVRNPKKAMDEIRRVLKPGGRLIFFEHVLSCSEKTARWQHRIDPMWNRVGCGCHLNRDTASTIIESGFAFRQLDAYESSRMGPSISSQVIEGIAVKDGDRLIRTTIPVTVCPTWGIRIWKFQTG